MKKQALIIIMASLIVVVLFLQGDKYVWICENGQWNIFMLTKPCEEIKISNINNFQQCIDTGNLVTESYPRRCHTDDKIFIEDIRSENEKFDTIFLDSPRPNQIIKSPLTVKGIARGFWFFEGDFPVILTNRDGLIIAKGIAIAKEEWMTEEFVPFEAVIEFIIPKHISSGTLIFQKNNPSDFREHDEFLEIPVLF